ncbi:MAG: nitroreductase family protein [Mogibacterium sp.]|nr:nitroreductase family protein [Mogibacterium sp.]
MEFKEVIRSRYSCRKYSHKAVETEKLDAILEAGRVAPTAKNLQEQRIYVLQSEDALAKIDSVTPCRFGAPIVIAVAFDKNNVYTYPGEMKTSGDEDATIVATHMILAAADEGLGSCWLNRFDPQKTAELLGLPENEELVMLMDVGYAAEDAAPSPMHDKRKEISETVRYL